jgi:GNAT superfamily N-acetyltransferase
MSRTRKAVAGTVKRLDPAELTFRPATPSRWRDVVRLFGDRGACGGCWCMLWRLPRREWEAGKGAGNRRALERLIASGRRPGVLAYRGSEPIAWCAIAPRPDYPALQRSRVMAPIDDEPVWSISCLFVARQWRRQGVSVQLLRAAVEFAGRQGARIVEGYPIEPSLERAPDAFVWLGVPAAFRRAGFREVARRSPGRPVMRRTVHG